MLQLGNRSSRAGTVAALVSALVPLAALPHVLEDLAAGTLDGFGLTPLAAGLLVGGALSVQLLGALGALRERRGGYVVILLAALAWIAVTLIDHPSAFLAGEFREGMSSRVAVWALVGLQAVAAVAALAALRSSRRASFSGTGTFTSGTGYGG